MNFGQVYGSILIQLKRQLFIFWALYLTFLAVKSFIIKKDIFLLHFCEIPIVSTVYTFEIYCFDYFGSPGLCYVNRNDARFIFDSPQKQEYDSTVEEAKQMWGKVLLTSVVTLHASCFYVFRLYIFLGMRPHFYTLLVWKRGRKFLYYNFCTSLKTTINR